MSTKQDETSSIEWEADVDVTGNLGITKMRLEEGDFLFVVPGYEMIQTPHQIRLLQNALMTQIGNAVPGVNVIVLPPRSFLYKKRRWWRRRFAR